MIGRGAVKDQFIPRKPTGKVPLIVDGHALHSVGSFRTGLLKVYYFSLFRQSFLSLISMNNIEKAKGK